MRRKSMQGGGQRHGGGHSGGGHGGGHGGGQRRSGGGGHSGGGGYSNNRPRKNYPQLREKYLNQAKDMLSVGDRVMAEYYFQHADHCYRMMVEEGWRPRDNNQQEHTQADGTSSDNAHTDNTHTDNAQGDTHSEPQAASAEESMPNAGALPSFLTMGYTATAAANNVEQAAANPSQAQWEEN